MCVGVLERSTNADVLTAMAGLSKLAPEIPGKVAARCLPSILSVGLKLGLMEPEGDVIKCIVVGALKDEDTKSAIAPWFLALWFSQENAWSVFDSYGIQAADLLPHISGATDVLARHFSDKQNVAKSAHHLVRNLCP